jgi:hypothetical protein
MVAGFTPVAVMVPMPSVSSFVDNLRGIDEPDPDPDPDPELEPKADDPAPTGGRRLPKVNPEPDPDDPFVPLANADCLSIPSISPSYASSKDLLPPPA